MVRPLKDSFRDAWSGLRTAVQTQRNMRIHLGCALLVLMAGYILPLSRPELVVVILCIGLVIIAEIFNTVIETVVDLATEEYHPLAARAKDLAAGGVLIAAIMAVVVGVIIFLPKIGTLFY
ncbi:MAG: diacylglycerol kinase family protein [Limnochordia bacterium]|jgi:diacylglycerol kinase